MQSLDGVIITLHSSKFCKLNMVELLNKDEKVFSLIITIMIYISRDTIFVHSLKPDSLQLVAVVSKNICINNN